jgi:two-component system, cell cycle sensor histidine kinase and response regulator CckA
MLLVRDSGEGIPSEIQHRVFEPFFTTKDLGRGTGLGLATVYGIVKQAKGAIEVESRMGQGTTFRIYLPAISPEEAGVPQAGKSPVRSIPASTILLAEDEPGVRSLGATVLRMAGSVVLEAGDGTEAIEISRNYAGRIDLLVSDLMMPRMRGTELADRLRATRPGMRVLYITGYAREAVDGRAFEGATSLLKPFSPDQLVQAVSAALAGNPTKTS